MRYTICYLLLFGLNIQLVAQVCDSTFFEATIKGFEDSEQPDSVIYYRILAADCARKADRLDVWVYAYLDLYVMDKSVNQAYLDAILEGAWRQARNCEEATGLLWAYRYKARPIQRSGDIHQATKWYERFAEQYRRLPCEKFNIVERCLKALGNNYTRLGEYERALLVMGEIAEIANQQNNYDLQAANWINMSIVYEGRGNLGEALVYCQKAAALPDLSLKRLGFIYNALANLYLQYNDLEAAQLYNAKAITALQTAQESALKIDYRIREWQAGAYNTQSAILKANEQFVDAQEALEKAIKLVVDVFETTCHRRVAKYHIDFGNLYQVQGQFDRAINQYNKALECLFPNFKAKIAYQNPDAKDFYPENTIFDALAAKADALATWHQEVPNSLFLEAALDCHDLAFEAEYNLRNTFIYQSSKLKLQAISRLRDEQAISIAYQLFEDTGNQAYIDKALYYAERSKAISLLEAIQTNLLERNNETTRFDWTPIDSLEKLLVRTEQKLLRNESQEEQAAYKVEKTALLEQLQVMRATTGVDEFVQKVITPEEVKTNYQQLTKTGLVFFWGEKKAYLFEIQPNQPIRCHLLNNHDDIEIQLLTYLKQIKERAFSTKHRDSLINTGHTLYKLLIAPYTTADKVDVLIVPDGILSFLPFEALIPIKEPLTYWIEQRNFQYAYSLSTHVALHELRSRAKKNALAIAPLSFHPDERNLKRLVNSKREVNAIPFDFVSRQIGVVATKENFLESCTDYRILHLSTHASLSTHPNQPIQVEFYDQALLLPEIYNLDLQSELVVLSACSTGKGKWEQGEGVMSLARAFMYAGTQSVVASLWKVNHHSTADVLEGFYDQLGQEKTKAKALQQAKLNYLEQARSWQKSPYYWAGFVFVGQDNIFEPYHSVFSYKWSMLGFVVLLAAGIYWVLQLRKA